MRKEGKCKFLVLALKTLLHTLPIKLRAIYDAGFTQVEVGLPDLETYAHQEFNGDYNKLDEGGKGDLDKLCEAAKKVRGLCHELGIEVLVVHPFSTYEGYGDAQKKKQGLGRAQAWFRVLRVGSSDDPDSSCDFDVIARDLCELADLAAKQDPPIRIAYEMWAWGVHVNTWENTWDICRRVDRPNFGVCLDTFQICARAYASPVSSSRVLPDAQKKLQASLINLSKTVPASKIFYFQIFDGSKNAGSLDMFAAGLGAGTVLGGFGGYLPVLDVIREVLRTGWRGPWSYEVFYGESMGKDDVGVPRFWTMVVKKCYTKVIETLRKGM
ncbi:uncharacterized protein PHACADRAFT_170959 [Phanerochaete carnosa HHB-10118-sp]|uniref:Xylose isomerase-like TIM barrel domain-containing protein n=1 Tax=Phanerochaete carnosa (strain HHB-10118-sp) TaxID=650164 RepID=K5W1L9_PHACS|nr:uncharacterized protein PHACADRAFT_170959 [Phanerochaete carnosa HHB-10118-sp]EKM57748.1 hypothetical protein PHACADRAFT_170959 [Phanerochaete carnosa HHB-10118-sp]